MDEEQGVSLSLKKSTATIILGAVVAVSAIISIIYMKSPFTAPFLFSMVLLCWAAYYTLSKKTDLSEMCCMMSGMVFGIIAGFFVGTLAALVTADFLVGIVIGTVAGLIFGIPMGRMGRGSALGRMEGVMAGPMGGMMGGMLGIMIRFYNVELFMPFFISIIILTVWEMVYVIYQHANRNISKNLIGLGILISIAALATSVFADYSNIGTASGSLFAQPTGEPTGNTVVPTNNGVQEVNLKMGAVGYEPSTITVNKGSPVKINLQAAKDAGCTRSIVFPDFKISKVVERGSTDTVQFTPEKAGTYQFRCSMNMARGTLVVI